MKPLTDVHKIYRPHNTALINMCAKFGGPSFKIATENVGH